MMLLLIDAKLAVPPLKDNVWDRRTCARQSPEICQGDNDCSDKLCTENLKCTLDTTYVCT